MNAPRLKIALAASLAGNLFLLGLIAGTHLLGAGRHDREPSPRHGRFAAVAERLDPVDAEALRTLLRRTGEAAEPRALVLRTTRRELDAALGRPQYDPQAVRAALERMRAEEMSLRGEFDTALIGFAAGLEPDERRAIAPLLRNGGRGWRGERRKSDGHERPREERKHP